MKKIFDLHSKRYRTICGGNGERFDQGLLLCVECWRTIICGTQKRVTWFGNI